MKYLACALALGVVLCANRADSQTFTTLVEFTGTGGTASGWSPIGGLTIGGTTLYGVTEAGGVHSDGNIFSVGMDGTNYQNLASFTGTGGTASGRVAYCNLTLIGPTLYGMTEYGGANADGNIFSVGTDGTNYQSILSFTGSGGVASGFEPFANLTPSGTTLYGMTYAGGANNNGNIFSVGTGGTNYQNLVSFTGTGGTAIGQYPTGSLTLGGTTLYGMTTEGFGVNGAGNIFSVGTDGTNYQNILSFTGTGGSASGQYAYASLILSGTTLFGMTPEGGANGDGNIFSVGTDGTNYQNLVSLSGTGGSASGNEPYGSLILSGTTLYGMTAHGGVHANGNIFSVGIDGSDFEDLYDFTGGADGGTPLGDLTLSGGTLFGMTADDGVNRDGTVFAMTLPTPEPGTLALAAAGAVAMVVSYRWRRMRGQTGLAMSNVECRRNVEGQSSNDRSSLGHSSFFRHS